MLNNNSLNNIPLNTLNNNFSHNSINNDFINNNSINNNSINNNSINNNSINNDFINNNSINNNSINNKSIHNSMNNSMNNSMDNTMNNSMDNSMDNSINNSINKNNLMMNSLSKNSYLYTTKSNLNKLPNDSELQEHQLKQDILKFTDDNKDFVEFKYLVKSWLELDDDIKTLRKATSERNKQKKELTPQILKYMQENKIYNLNTQSGKLKCRKSIRTKSLNNTTLKEKLIIYFQNVDRGTKAAEFLVSNKDKVENITLSRVMYRRKIKKNVLNI